MNQGMHKGVRAAGGDRPWAIPTIPIKDRQRQTFMLCTVPSESGQMRAERASLNPEQRRAVEHGCDALHDAPPLLIIAGAGSGIPRMRAKQERASCIALAI